MDFIFVLVLAALWGSFANVCIHRLPLEKGVVSGRSFCPNCKKLITWKDNIPIISFLFLKGKCRYCNKKISSQYLLVEAMSVLLFLIIYILYGLSITTLLLLILSLSFLIIFFYKQIRKKEGMGLGDAKLLSAIGFWFGWFSIPFVIFLSSIIALLSVAPSLINKSKKFSSQIPFGPYIILGTLIYLIFESNIRSIIFY